MGRVVPKKTTTSNQIHVSQGLNKTGNKIFPFHEDDDHIHHQTDHTRTHNWETTHWSTTKRPPIPRLLLSSTYIFMCVYIYILIHMINMHMWNDIWYKIYAHIFELASLLALSINILFNIFYHINMYLPASTCDSPCLFNSPNPNIHVIMVLF